jgi:Tol biopolymer transport system component
MRRPRAWVALGALAGAVALIAVAVASNDPAGVPLRVGGGDTSTTSTSEEPATTSTEPSMSTSTPEPATTTTAVAPSSRVTMATTSTPPAPPLATAASFDEPAVYVMRSDGSGLSKLVADPAVARGVSLSPNGRRVAFRTGSKLEVVNVDGTGRRVVLTGGMSGDSLSWSSDNRTVAFIGDNADGHRLRVVDVETGTTSALGADIRDVNAIDFHPTDQQIAFVALGRLQTIRADGTGLRTIYGAKPPALYSVDWSPDGRRLSFTRNCAADLAIINADGSGLVTLGWAFTGERESQWAPDGNRIAYNNSSRLMTSNPDGSNKAELAHPASGVAWTPDSTRVLVTAFRENIDSGTGLRTVRDALLVRQDGSEQRALVSDRNGTQTMSNDFEWLPDGSAVVFTATNHRDEAVQYSEAHSASIAC